MWYVCTYGITFKYFEIEWKMKIDMHKSQPPCQRGGGGEGEA